MSKETSPQLHYQPMPSDRRHPPMPRVEAGNSYSAMAEVGRKALTLLLTAGAVAGAGYAIDRATTTEGSATTTIRNFDTAAGDICDATIKAANNAGIGEEQIRDLTKRAAGIDNSVECATTFNDMVRYYDIASQEELRNLGVTVTVTSDMFGVTAEAKPANK